MVGRLGTRNALGSGHRHERVAYGEKCRREGLGMKTRANGDCSKTSELSNVGMTTCKPQPISAADAVPRRSTLGTPEPVMTNHAQAGSAQIDLSSPVAILSERSSGCAVSGLSQHRRLHAQVDTSWPDPKPPVNLWLYQ